MHHGCYKLCPKVREQERKAFEARENLDDSDSSSLERIRDTAGPSGLQKIDRPLSRKRSKTSSNYSSGVATPRTKKNHTPDDESYESLRNPDKRQRKHSRPGKSDESLRNPDKRQRKHGRPGNSDESLRNDERSDRAQSGGRKYSPEIVDPSRVGRGKPVEITFGRESPSKTSGASRKLGPERKIHRRSQTSQSERHEYPSEERRDEKTLSRQPEGERRKHSKGSAKDQLPDNDRLMTPARKDDKKAGSSRRRRGRKESMEDASDENRDEWSRDTRDNCVRNCRGINEIVRKMRNEKQQEALDEYIINKGLSYFGDLCNCHYACLVNQLWDDSFVTSTIASVAIFALGVKLCSEMEGWTIWNTF